MLMRVIHISIVSPGVPVGCGGAAASACVSPPVSCLFRRATEWMPGSPLQRMLHEALRTCGREPSDLIRRAGAVSLACTKFASLGSWQGWSRRLSASRSQRLPSDGRRGLAHHRRGGRAPGISRRRRLTGRSTGAKGAVTDDQRLNRLRPQPGGMEPMEQRHPMPGACPG